MAGGISRPRRSRFGRDVEPEDLALSNLLSIYNVVKEDEHERDNAIRELQLSYEFLDLCIEFMEKRPNEFVKYVKLPDMISIIMFIAKTEHSPIDNLVKSFIRLIKEFYDRPIYLPMIKLRYMQLLTSIILRVDTDSKSRGEYMQMLKLAGKKAGGVYTSLERDLKGYAKDLMREQAMSTVDEDDDFDDYEEDEDEDDEDDDDFD